MAHTHCSHVKEVQNKNTTCVLETIKHILAERSDTQDSIFKFNMPPTHK